MTTPAFKTLRQQRDELYRDARDHPDSDADQMVRILLLSAMSNQRSADDDEDLGAALARERRDYRQARAKRLREPQPADADTAGGKAAEDDAGDYSAQTRLEKIAQALDDMKAAAESGKEMDAQAVYERIADIVGLNSPLVPIGNVQKDDFGV